MDLESSKTSKIDIFEKIANDQKLLIICSTLDVWQVPEYASVLSELLSMNNVVFWQE